MMAFKDLEDIERRRERLWLLFTTCVAALSMVLLLVNATRNDAHTLDNQPTYSEQGER